MTLSTILLFILIQFVAVSSPGIDFLMVSQIALRNGRNNGIAAALAIPLANLVYLVLVLNGWGAIAHSAPQVIRFIQYAGAVYLIYLGVRCIQSRGVDSLFIESGSVNAPLRQSFATGFWVSITNPKVLIYFTTVLTQFVPINATLGDQGIVSAIVLTEAGLWFSFVAYFISHPKIRSKYVQFSRWIDRILGVLFFGLALKMLIS